MSSYFVWTIGCLIADLLLIYCKYLYSFFKFILLFLLFCGWCILTHHLHVGSSPSPLSWVWCSYMSPASGLGGRSVCNWKGLWLALCTRPLPCQLIGTVRSQNTPALPLIDGYRFQGCFFLTTECYTQLAISATTASLCITSNLFQPFLGCWQVQYCYIFSTGLMIYFLAVNYLLYYIYFLVRLFDLNLMLNYSTEDLQYFQKPFWLLTYTGSTAKIKDKPEQWGKVWVG